MSSNITEIRNLTSGQYIFSTANGATAGDGKSELKPILIDDATNSINTFADQITAEVTFTTTAATSKISAGSNDNIQVVWNSGRAAGGRLVIADGGKTFKITGLQNLSKFTVDLRGKIDIGPKSKPDTIQLSVRMGNATGDTIIDFSDQTDGANPSQIALNDLIDWVAGKTGDEPSAISLPSSDSGNDGGQDGSSFSVVFNQFHFNVTQRSFNLNVQSVGGNSMTFGVFTLKDIGFMITNEPQNVSNLPAASE